MDDRQKDDHEPSIDPFEEFIEQNKHFKWPLTIVFIVIVIIVILMDIFYPNK